MLTLAPLNFVPGDAATGGADGEPAATEGGAATDGAADEVGAVADGDGLAEALQAVTTRMVLIAAATMRYRDTAESPPLDIPRRLFSILNTWRYAGQYADGLRHSQDTARGSAGWPLEGSNHCEGMSVNDVARVREDVT